MPKYAAATPVFSPKAGTYSSPQSVKITSSTTGATIRYTLDGTTPTAASTLYTGPVAVAKTLTVKAIAMKTGYRNSAVASAKYTINLYTVMYDGNGANGGLPPVDSKSYAKGATVTVAGQGSLVKDGGYMFNGWNTANDGFGTARAVGSTFAMGSADVTLYARWVIDTTYPNPDFLGNIPSINYDGISTEVTTDPYVITPATYQSHITIMKNHRLAPMTLRDFVAAASSPSFPADFPRRPLLLFSDVSGLDFKTDAMPILTAAGYTATLGVETKLVVDQPHEDWAMTPADLTELQGKGIEIASHSRTHPDLTLASDAALVDEIANTKTVLSGFGLDITDFIYPFGSTDARVQSAVRSAGYGAARSTSGQALAEGGYSTINPDRRLDLGCAVVTKAATTKQLEQYIVDPMIEVEDIFSVVNDAGTLGRIERAGTDFSKDSYGCIYMPDRNDEVSIPVVVFNAGTYRLRFRVKTGGSQALFESSPYYEYRLDGGQPLVYVSEGPVVAESADVAWGYHRMDGIYLAAGLHWVNIRSLEDWAAMVDGLYIDRTGD